MKFSTLHAWLAWQERLHPLEIDLGLDRVRSVLSRVAPAPLRCPVVTIAGTNGKGSCVAILESILSQGGYRLGTFTSPHLCRYNERICVEGQPVSDEVITEAFAEIDEAREETSLTYFEFSALAALSIFSRADLDVVLLEVGMGGRLDAVNVVDAEVAAVTSIGVDHQYWLGEDREAIAWEKAGIFRADRPAICGDADVPTSLRNHARDIGARLLCVGEDFHYEIANGHWNWRGTHISYSALPRPGLFGPVQVANAATALAVLEQLDLGSNLSEERLQAGLRAVSLAGRFQVIDGSTQWVLDVAHNPDAVRTLADNLRRLPDRTRTIALVAALKDKDVEAMARILAPEVDEWIAVSLSSDRGLSADALATRLESVLDSPVTRLEAIDDALGLCRSRARADDRVLIFGSFHLIGPVLERLEIYCGRSLVQSPGYV